MLCDVAVIDSYIRGPALQIELHMLLCMVARHNGGCDNLEQCPLLVIGLCACRVGWHL